MDVADICNSPAPAPTPPCTPTLPHLVPDPSQSQIPFPNLDPFPSYTPCLTLSVPISCPTSSPTFSFSPPPVPSSCDIPGLHPDPSLPNHASSTNDYPYRTSVNPGWEVTCSPQESLQGLKQTHAVESCFKVATGADSDPAGHALQLPLTELGHGEVPMQASVAPST